MIPAEQWLTSEDSKSFLLHMTDKIPGTLIRAARELLGWSQNELAKKASCGPITVRRIEKGGAFHVEGTRDRIIEAIQMAGIRFIPQTSDEGAGLRWATPSAQPPEPPAKRRREQETKDKAEPLLEENGNSHKADGLRR